MSFDLVVDHTVQEKASLALTIAAILQQTRHTVLYCLCALCLYIHYSKCPLPASHSQKSTWTLHINFNLYVENIYMYSYTFPDQMKFTSLITFMNDVGENQSYAIVISEKLHIESLIVHVPSIIELMSYLLFSKELSNMSPRISITISCRKRNPIFSSPVYLLV